MKYLFLTIGVAIGAGGCFGTLEIKKTRKHSTDFRAELKTIYGRHEQTGVVIIGEPEGMLFSWIGLTDTAAVMVLERAKREIMMRNPQEFLRGK